MIKSFPLSDWDPGYLYQSISKFTLFFFLAVYHVIWTKTVQSFLVFHGKSQTSGLDRLLERVQKVAAITAVYSDICGQFVQ